MSKQFAATVAAVVVGAATVGYAAPAGAANGVVGSGPCATDPPPRHESIVPKIVEYPLPYPAIAAVPPEQPASTTRISEPLPADPCMDPCPDLTDESASGTGSSASGLPIPGVIVRPQPFYFGIPVPGPEQPAPVPPEHVNPPIEPAPQSIACPTPRIGAVSEVAKQTGASSINRTDKRWQVHGTDLGIMWESAPGEVAVAFGDTAGKGFRPPGFGTTDFRSNVLAFSTDRNLADGASYDRMVTDSRCHATELLASRKMDNIEVTTIPTSGFAIGDRQYMSYMSIRKWNSLPGTWMTNYGGIAYSDDHGQTWTKDPYAKWDNIFGLANFQVTSMVPQGDYVYMFGTRNTRLGDIGLARVPKAEVLNKSAYQYWAQGNWTAVGGEGAASPIVSGTAAELSVRYDADRRMWQMAYLDTTKAAIVLRESATPQGVWSDGAPMVSIEKYPALYGRFIHPWPSGSDLYFNISTWTDYNVYQMHAQVN